MNNVSSVRLTVPKELNREIARSKLIGSTAGRQEKFIYVSAAAGYGKTTLLSQFARSSQNAVWVSAAGDNDIFVFVDILCKSIRQTFGGYSFTVSEYLPFLKSEDFIIILTNALIVSIENTSEELLLILDDLHTIKDEQIKEFVACFMRFAPEKFRVFIGSREPPFQQLAPLRARGDLLVLGQPELAFTREESAQLLGYDNMEIFNTTEGWPLAIGSYRVLLESGVKPGDISLQGKEILYSYLFYECIGRLSSEMVDFLRLSACFEELEPAMLDAVLEKSGSKSMLENLTVRNLFTTKTGSGYRFHALFRQSLLEGVDTGKKLALLQKAAMHYFDKKDFSRAAEYAAALDDKSLLKRIIAASYRNMIRSGSFSELHMWFQTLEDDSTPDSLEILVAKGAYLSCIGNFTEAQKYLDAAIPLLDKNDGELRLEAMLHKTRVLRNSISFEASNDLLNRLLLELDDYASETAYLIIVEKLYNLCMDSRMGEALALAQKGIEDCARAGNLKVRAWYERYLSVVYFFAGNMRKSVSCYEKSLALPEDEREYLEIHDIGIFVAKAYQMLGEKERALSVLGDSLQKMRSTGRYEEIWLGYLFAAEIHFQDAVISRSNGKSASFDTTVRYFILANEYAPLYRKTDYQLHWTKLQQLSYSLMFSDGPKENIIREINLHIGEVSDFFKCIVLSRLMGYLAAVGDYQNASLYANRCIGIGEKAGLLLFSAVAYGAVIRAFLASGETESAKLYTGRFLKLCAENGILAYFKARQDYDPILKFALDNGIEPEAAAQIMEFSGFTTKKAYIKTFGEFAVFFYADRSKAIKLRTKRERELLAFLLNVGENGATKEEIYGAIWWESESKDVKKLIGVNLAQIKKDLSVLQMENIIVYHSRRYSINRNEIECDFDLLENAARNIQESAEWKKAALSLYTGEYLLDFEALWAEPNRIYYKKVYEKLLL